MERQAKDTPEGARRRAGAEPDTTPDRPGKAMKDDAKFGPGQGFKDDLAGGNRYEGGLAEGKRTGGPSGVPFVQETAGSVRDGGGRPAGRMGSRTVADAGRTAKKGRGGEEE